MRYLLDTCVISDFIKGEAGTKVRLKQAPPVDIDSADRRWLKPF